MYWAFIFFGIFSKTFLTYFTPGIGPILEDQYRIKFIAVAYLSLHKIFNSLLLKITQLIQSKHFKDNFEKKKLFVFRKAIIIFFVKNKTGLQPVSKSVK